MKTYIAEEIKGTLFNNRHIHDFPQWHFVESDLPIDELVLKTGMVSSKSQLKRLYKQGAIYVEEIPDPKHPELLKTIRIGQRRLELIKGGKQWHRHS